MILTLPSIIFLELLRHITLCCTRIAEGNVRCSLPLLAEPRPNDPAEMPLSTLNIIKKSSKAYKPRLAPLEERRSKGIALAKRVGTSPWNQRYPIAPCGIKMDNSAARRVAIGGWTPWSQSTPNHPPSLHPFLQPPDVKALSTDNVPPFSSSSRPCPCCLAPSTPHINFCTTCGTAVSAKPPGRMYTRKLHKSTVRDIYYTVPHDDIQTYSRLRPCIALLSLQHCIDKPALTALPPPLPAAPGEPSQAQEVRQTDAHTRHIGDSTHQSPTSSAAND
jgi:hypothetical protein